MSVELALVQANRVLELTGAESVARHPNLKSALCGLNGETLKIKADIVNSKRVGSGQALALDVYEREAIKLLADNPEEPPVKKSKTCKTKRIAYVLRGPVTSRDVNGLLAALANLKGDKPSVNGRDLGPEQLVVRFANSDKMLTFETPNRCVENSLWEHNDDGVAISNDYRELYRPRSVHYWEECNVFRVRLDWYDTPFTELEIETIKAHLLANFLVHENVIENRPRSEGESPVTKQDTMQSVNIYFGIHVKEAIHEWTCKGVTMDPDDYTSRRFRCWGCMHDRHWTDIDADADCFERLLAKYARSRPVQCCSACRKLKIYSSSLNKCRMGPGDRDSDDE
jgi:hypothetical protein